MQGTSPAHRATTLSASSWYISREVGPWAVVLCTEITPRTSNVPSGNPSTWAMANWSSTSLAVSQARTTRTWSMISSHVRFEVTVAYEAGGVGTGWVRAGG